MIDPVNSLALSLPAATGSGTPCEHSPGGPAFIQVLQALLGTEVPAKNDLPAGADDLLPDLVLSNGLTIQANGDAASDFEAPGLPAGKELDGHPTALQMMFAMLSVAAAQHHPWQGHPVGPTTIEEMEDGLEQGDEATSIPDVTGPEDAVTQYSLRLQQLLAGQSIGSFEAASRPLQTAEEHSPDHVIAPSTNADIPSGSSLSTRPAEAAEFVLRQEALRGKDAQSTGDGKAAPLDSESVQGAGRSPEAALRVTGSTTQDQISLPEALQTARAMAKPAVAGGPDSALGVQIQDRPLAVQIQDRIAGIEGPWQASLTSQHGPQDVNVLNSAAPAFPVRPIARWIGGSGEQPGEQDRASGENGPSEGITPLGKMERPLERPDSGFHLERPDAAQETVLRASVAEQVARRAHLMVARGQASMDIQLEPRELGKVRIHVELGSDGLNVRLAADASDTRGVLQASLPQLRDALENQGLRVERFDVALTSGFSAFSSAQDNDRRQRLTGGESPSHHTLREDMAPEQNTSPEAILASSLVDYRI